MSNVTLLLPLWISESPGVSKYLEVNTQKRSSECFQVKRGLTNRLRDSAIPHMQRLLNEKEKRKKKICRKISNHQPVNNGVNCKSVSLRN